MISVPFFIFSLFFSGCGSSQTNPAILYALPSGSTGGVGGVYKSCIPLNEPISFSATGIYYDNDDILAGSIPNIYSSPERKGQAGNQFGAVNLISGATGGAYTRRSAGGTLSMNISLGAGTSSLGSTAARATGIITLSYTKLQSTLGTLDYTTTHTLPCAIGAAISLTHIGTQLNSGGIVYIFTNSPQSNTYNDGIFYPFYIAPTIHGTYFEL